MTCKQLVDLITDYLDGALPAPDRLRFEEHLDRCPPCRTYVEQVRHTIRAAGGLKEGSIPLNQREELLRAFRQWRKR